MPFRSPQNTVRGQSNVTVFRSQEKGEEVPPKSAFAFLRNKDAKKRINENTLFYNKNLSVY